MFQALYDCCCSLLRFFQVVRNNGLWLTPALAKSVGDGLHLFCAAYCHLARDAFAQGAFLYHLEPSLHMVKHVADRLTTLAATAPVIMSPAAFLTDLSEDFVGICSRLSRRVAARTTGHRTLQRLLIQMWFKYEDWSL